MSAHKDGRISLGSDKVHIESIHPNLVIPVSQSSPPWATTTTDLSMRIRVPRGDIPGVSHINKFGLNIDLEKDIAEDIYVHMAAPGLWVGPTEARIHQIDSSDGGDDAVAVGAGAWTLRVIGLDSSGLLAQEDIIMDGTNDVPTTRAYIMIHRMYVLTSGSSGGNTGNIYATADVDGTITAVVPAMFNQTFMAIYQIPYDKQGFMSNLWYTALRKKATGAVDVVMFLKTRETNVWRPQHLDAAVVTGTSKAQHWYDPYRVFEGGDLIRLNATASEAAMNVAGGFDLYLVNVD